MRYWLYWLYNLFSDNNECFRGRGGCQHQCINTLGSFECKCNAGYSLDPDGKKCQCKLQSYHFLRLTYLKMINKLCHIWMSESHSFPRVHVHVIKCIVRILQYRYYSIKPYQNPGSVECDIFRIPRCVYPSPW